MRSDSTPAAPRDGKAGALREELRKFSEEIRDSLTVEHLGTSLLRTARRLIPVERIGFFTLHPVKKRLQLAAEDGYEIMRRRSVPFEFERLRTSLRNPVALEGSVAPGAARVEPGDRDVFRRWRMAVAFPLLDPGREVLGFFVLGRKRSGTAFTRAEIDVLGLIADQAAVAAARINLQQKLLVRYAETERLEELNRIKSDFVSSVSHELKTPLTSIKMMAEMLQGSPRTPHAKVRRYAEVLEGEADRLTRLIDNILDFSKIERGVKEYAMTGTNLNDAVVRVMEIMAYPLAMESFTPTVTLAADPGTIQADPDALAGALLNIVSNGMKYSPERREIGVETYRRGDVSGVTVRDRGVGIAAGERETIFEPFFRGAAARCASIGGVGLGLTLVKHFLDAHRATIALEDVPGGGTSVSLLFPLAPPERTAPA